MQPEQSMGGKQETPLVSQHISLVKVLVVQ